jgi:hypothetical protein
LRGRRQEHYIPSEKGVIPRRHHQRVCIGARSCAAIGAFGLFLSSIRSDTFNDVLAARRDRAGRAGHICSFGDKACSGTDHGEEMRTHWDKNLSAESELFKYKVAARETKTQFSFQFYDAQLNFFKLSGVL